MRVCCYILMPGERVYCCVKGCLSRSYTKPRCLERLASVKLVEELLQFKKKEIAGGHSISTKSFLCEECCPHIPLLGKRVFKSDNAGNGWYGIVMEIEAQTAKRGGRVSTTHPLWNGSLKYSVNWACSATNEKRCTSEFQKSLEKMVKLRGQIEGHHKVQFASDYARKKASV